MDSNAEQVARSFADYLVFIAKKRAEKVTAFQLERINASQRPLESLRAIMREAVIDGFRRLLVVIDEEQGIDEMESTIRIVVGKFAFPDRTWSLHSALAAAELESNQSRK